MSRLDVGIATSSAILALFYSGAFVYLGENVELQTWCD